MKNLIVNWIKLYALHIDWIWIIVHISLFFQIKGTNYWVETTLLAITKNISHLLASLVWFSWPRKFLSSLEKNYCIMKFAHCAVSAYLSYTSSTPIHPDPCHVTLVTFWQSQPCPSLLGHEYSLTSVYFNSIISDNRKLQCHTFKTKNRTFITEYLYCN